MNIDNHFLGMSRRDLQDNAIMLLIKLRDEHLDDRQKEYAKQAADKLIFAWKKRLREEHGSMV